MEKQTITIRLRPDHRWGQLIHNAALDFGQACGFALNVAEMSADAILECVEEYVRVCGEHSSGDFFTLDLEGVSEALSFHLTYPKTVFLNPTEVDDYEIPEAEDDASDLDISGLWLHLVKKKMDRVYFRREGESRSLHLIKYRRNPGKVRQHWVMNLSPKLVSDVQIDEKRVEGLAMGIAQRPGSHDVVRLDPVALYVLKRLDGKTTFWRIYLDCTEELGPVSPQRLGNIYEWLEEDGFLEGPSLRKKRSARMLDFFESLFALDFGTSSADRFVTALHRLARPLFNPTAVTIMLLATVSGLIPAWLCRKEIAGNIGRIDRSAIQNPLFAFAVYGSILAAVAIHELGHGLTCKHFGGRVNRFGVMYYLVMFIFYCDVSTSWNFARKRDRLLVSLAGPFTTALLASACAWLFYLLPPSCGFARPVFGVLGGALAFGVVMNFNPFIRMDGYYMLMDLAECPNLRSRAFLYIFSRLRGRKLAGGPAPGRLPPKLKHLFWFYGIGGVMVTVVFLVRPVWFFLSALMSASDVRSGRIFIACVLLVLILARVALRAATVFKSRRNKSWKLA